MEAPCCLGGCDHLTLSRTQRSDQGRVGRLSVAKHDALPAPALVLALKSRLSRSC